MSERPSSGESLGVSVGVGSDASRVLVRLQGEIDLATAPALERRLNELVRDGAALVIVDLSAVSFCDVTGLKALLRAEAQLRVHGGRLQLLGPCHLVDQMVSHLGLTDRLPVEQPAGGDGAGDGHGPGQSEGQICPAASTIWA